MRINAGKFKGVPILTRDIAGTRPTSDKIKQALFNILGPSIQGKAVLDLYAGFGALGLEALSRGASPVVFVEHNPKCTKVLRENISRLKEAGAAAEILTEDIFQAMRRLEKDQRTFDIVLSDAPYSQGNAKLLNVLADSGILTPESLLLLQHDRKEQLPASAGRWKTIRSYHYGNSSLTIYRQES